MAIDEKKKKDLLARFAKSTELAIKLIEDDSSGDGTDGGTQVKILHLVQPVNAVGSIPTPDGSPMKATNSLVYVAQDDIDKMLENVEEKDGILVYKGDMHLDVSKPGGRMVQGQFVITKPAKIWLTSIKFSRRGGQLRTSQTNNLGDMINKMFSGGKTVDLSVEASAKPAGDTNDNKEQGKPSPTIVANGTKDAISTP